MTGRVTFADNQRMVDVQQLEQHIDNLKTAHASQLAHEYAHLKRLYDEVDSLRKRLSKQVEFMKTNLVPNAFEKEKISSFTTDDGYRITVSQRVFASCPAETKSEAYQWLKDNGFENIVSETVNAGTLSALAKNIMSGQDPDSEIFELPESLFKVEIRPQVSSTKTK